MTAPLRTLFLMQQVLGHATHAASIERAARDDGDLDVRWVPVTYHRPGGWIERLPVPAGARGVGRAALEVQAALFRERPQVILFNSPAPAISALPWLGRVPAVISLDVTARQFDQEGEHFGHAPDGGGAMARAKHRVNAALLRRTRLLAPWSRWAAASLRDDYGVPDERITVVPPGVDLEAWRPASRPEAGDALPQVLFVGGDFVRKGGDLLLEWYRHRGRARCRLVIVSRDPAALAAAELGADVRRSEVPNAEGLRSLYRESDVFVLPSRSEPFGIAAVEALASGVPAVVARTGGLGEIVDDGVEGLTVPPGDPAALGQALDTLLEDAWLRRRLGAAARRQAELRFDERRNGRRILELLKEAAAGDGRREWWAAPAGEPRA